MPPGLKKSNLSSIGAMNGTPNSEIVTSTFPSHSNAPSPPIEPMGVGALNRKRVRGPTCGKRVRNIIVTNKKRIEVYVTPEMRAFCGINATKVSNELGLQIRRTCHTVGFKHTWKLVDPPLKEVIIQAVRDKFKITEYEDGEEFTELVQEVVNEKANIRYIGWKSDMCRHFTKKKKVFKKTKKASDHPYQHPFPGVRDDGWRFLVDHIFKDPAFKKRRKAGKENRKSLPYNHTLGSRSFPAAMTIQADKEFKEANKNKEEGDKDIEVPLPDFCLLFEKSHKLRDTDAWITDDCEKLHTKLITLRDEAIEVGTPLTGEQLSRQGLGERSNYIKGFGVGPKPSSYSSKSSSDIARQKQLQKVQHELDSLREERNREREEDLRHFKEEGKRRDEANDTLRKEMEEMKMCLMLMQNSGSNI